MYNFRLLSRTRLATSRSLPRSARCRPCPRHHAPLDRGSPFPLLSNQPKLRDTLGIKLLLVAEGHWLEREDRFTCLVHAVNVLFETGRGGERAEPPR